ncbi:MAG TPA: LysR substrate-binding domain-containing protein, partial [Plasticicumulans sp.]|nr:LysR substrate-binding domain-containing protein [Plasticicumulans sp.]
ICAAPSYLERAGRPGEPSELAHHQTLSFSYLATGDSWSLVHRDGRQASVRIRPHVHASNGDILRDLAVEGLGIIVQPDFIVEKDIAAGRLEPITVNPPSFSSSSVAGKGAGSPGVQPCGKTLFQLSKPLISLIIRNK